jgi:hypothetical protein
MNKEQLKELVKAHFNLVEAPIPTEEITETFGEVSDENKAFKIKYDGDLKVGTEVYVETEEGQKSKAPDGYHKLADGKMIKTIDGKVVEIESKEEEMYQDEMSAVETTTEEPGDEQPEETTEVVEASMEEVINELMSAVKAELEKFKAELSEVKEKFAAVSAEPASEKTLPFAKGETKTNDLENAANADRIKMAINQIKNKK